MEKEIVYVSIQTGRRLAEAEEILRGVEIAAYQQLTGKRRSKRRGFVCVSGVRS